jgi:hypothetical protein
MNRYEALSDLIALRAPLPELASLLSELESDPDDDVLPEMRTKDAVHALDLFLDREISAHELEEWANLLEGREDFTFEKSQEEVLKDFIFSMANPDMNEPITPATAKKWKKQLGHASR